MSARNYLEREERLGHVKSRQVIWADWMREATAGLTDDDTVITLTNSTPFGNYLIGIKPATDGAAR